MPFKYLIQTENSEIYGSNDKDLVAAMRESSDHEEIVIDLEAGTTTYQGVDSPIEVFRSKASDYEQEDEDEDSEDDLED